MTKCYMCKQDITEKNISAEHIILNSLGGRLKSTQLLCRNCNSTHGNKIDANLSEQLGFFANWLDIKRENGDVQDVEMINESTGEKYKVTSKGIPILLKPIVEVVKLEDKTAITIKARSKKELKKHLIGLQRKYPTINVEQCVETANIIEEPISAPLHLTLEIGGKESSLAILKMAVNYYIEKTGDEKSVDEAISDLKNDQTNKVEPIILKAPLFDLSEDEITHSILINCNKEKQKIYAIIELYSAIQFIVKLSGEYCGNDWQDLYVYDVLARKELKKDIKSIPSFDDVFAFEYCSSTPDFTILQTRIERVMAIGAKRKKQSYISEAIEKSLAATWKRLPEGQLITEKDIKQLVSELRNNLAPIFMR